MSRGRQQWDAEIAMTAAAARQVEARGLIDPYENNPIDFTIYVSCYNESEYIENTLDTVCAAIGDAERSFEIIVIDDGSKDNSREIVKKYINEHPDLPIVLRANRLNKGLAQNFVDGAFLGRGKYYRLICGDNPEQRDSMARTFKAAGRADIIVPYYTSAEGKGMEREIISKCYTGLINLLTGNHIRYYNGLAVHLRHNVLRWHPNTRGFGFQAELLCLLIELGFTYEEIEYEVIERRQGRSNALTFCNLLSVMHTIMEIVARRISRLVYGGYRTIGK